MSSQTEHDFQGHGRNAVVFGAGRIGRGFLGQLLCEAGFLTIFVDTDITLVNALNHRREYPLHLVSEAGVQEITVSHVSALHLVDTAELSAALAHADLSVTAVGAANLPQIAPALALGFQARLAVTDQPLDILLCENQWHVGTLMHNLLRPHLPDDALFDRRIGLVETVIGRMVPAPPPGEDPLLLVAEPYGELPIARNSLRGPVPELPGLVAVDNFAAYEARKFFLHNAAHAALAYLGHERGHEFIWQCAADPDVQCVCRDALRESSEALVKEYGFTSQELDTFSEDLMHRFANQALGDTVTRVAADPRRKLRPDDRLLGAVSLCRKHGLEPTALGQVIASAHRYANLEEIA